MAVVHRPDSWPPSGITVPPRASSSRSGRNRSRGTVGWLPSGSARVKVDAGVDQLTGKKQWLRETVPARATRRETEREAGKVLTRPLNQVDERRSPRTRDRRGVRRGDRATADLERADHGHLR